MSLCSKTSKKFPEPDIAEFMKTKPHDVDWVKYRMELAKELAIALVKDHEIHYFEIPEVVADISDNIILHIKASE